ncbi:MAG: hypothetical protein K9M10_04115 [Candidatus Pacebacteria bacterium]|nr:hypothetical protein [Candidatus Paceibacterota bacterium]MCF7857630.1 hypothetical protein [Candidatus Paceibacterota bacterium]
MKFNLNILKRGEKIPQVRLKKRSGGYVNQVRDWTIGLGLAGITFIGGISYIAYDAYVQFWKVTDSANVGGKVETYNEKEVKAYAAIYDDKEKEFEALRGIRKTFIEQEKEVSVEVSQDEVLANDGSEQYTSPVPSL